MPNLIDKQQLQALATATANYANGKDAAIKNTIITALGGSTQSGGGSTTPTVTLHVDTENIPEGSEVVDIENGKRIYVYGLDEPSSYIDVTYTLA